MKFPRFIITAPASGSGKTLITCGILQALVNRGMDVASFKCGPDYIDPMFHSRVIGTPSRNLDPFFTDEGLMRYLFSRSAEGHDVSVIEGVMGFYDGIGMVTERGSTYDVSERLKAPVILVINCKGASLSVVPLIKGFMEFRKNNIKGVILNNTSEKVYRELSIYIENELGINVIGYVPKVSELLLESRHLGLCLPDEVKDLKEKLNQLASILESTLNIDLLLKISRDVQDLQFESPVVKKIEGSVKIGLADDEAFCFTYEDNMDLLRESGAEIIRFSPIHDSKLPDGIQGVIFSGGYPELHAKALSDNKSMLEDIRGKLSSGLPCMAECGGFMYLHDEIEDSEGVMRKTVGMIHGKVVNTKRLNRFGYISLESNDDSDIMPKGSIIKAHEFHYWDSDNCGCQCIAEKTNGRRYDCIHMNDRMVAGFPHLYYYSNPEIAYNFVESCSRFK